MPTDSKIKELEEKRASLWAQMQVLRDKDGTLTAEDDASWDAAEADLNAITKDIDRRSRMAALEAVQTKPIGDLTEREMSKKEETEAEKYERAYASYLVHGTADLSREDRQVLARGYVPGESRAQATGGPANAGSQTAGGYTVPPGFLVRMTETLKAYGGLIRYAEILNTSTGNPLEFPTNDDTANAGHILGENVQETNLADAVFGQKTLGAYMYTSGLVLVSYQLLQDSAFDLNNWLPNKLGIRLGRALSANLVTGNGTTAPEGIMTNIVNGVTPGAGTGAVTAFGTGGATGTAYGNLIDLQHSIDPAYRANARWLTSDAGLKSLRKLVDGNGRPLWEPYVAGSMATAAGSDGQQVANELGGGSGGTLLGHEVVIDQGVAVPAAGAKSMAFGDLQQAMIVRQVAGAQTLRLAERYADFLQVGFFGFARFDAKANQSAAIRSFINSAT